MISIKFKRDTIACWVAVAAILGWASYEWIESTRIVHASGLLSLPATVVQTNKSNTYTTGTQNFSAAVHTVPTIVVASVGALPASGCVIGELAVVSSATAGQQIYENSTAGSCTWTQQLAGSGGGGGVITYSGVGVTLTGTLFFPAGGGGVPSGTESNVDLASSSSATITNLSAQMSVAPGVGTSVAITWRKAGSDQSATCTIAGASATECQDTTHSFNVAQGDLIAYKVVATGVIAGTPNLSIMSQFGTITSGAVNSGSAHQTALYSSAGSTISGAGPGTSGQVWTSNGAGSDPTFQTSAGGGATVTSGPFGSAPSCTTSQFVYVSTDAGVVGYCNGSSSLMWKYGAIVVNPLGTGDTSWFNQSGATIVADTGAEGVILTSTAGGGNNLQARLKAVPGTPYTQIACFNDYGGQAFSQVGILWTDGTNISTSNFIELGLVYAGTTFTSQPGPQINISKGTGVTAGTTGYSLSTVPNAVSNSAPCFAFDDNGTNRKYAYSYDKQNWIVLLSTTRTDFLTPTQMGYFVNTSASSQISVMHVFSWETVGSALF